MKTMFIGVIIVGIIILAVLLALNLFVSLDGISGSIMSFDIDKISALNELNSKYTPCHQQYGGDLETLNCMTTQISDKIDFCKKYPNGLEDNGCDGLEKRLEDLEGSKEYYTKNP